MTSRYTNRVLLLIIVVLLITNVIMVMFFVFTPEQKKRSTQITPEAGMTNLLKDSVGFSEKQIADYMDLRSRERPKLKQYFGRMRQNKEKFYSLVTTAGADSVSLQLADSIAILQKEIDMHMRQYFLKIRNICTEDQLPAYDATIAQVVKRMTSRQGNRNRSGDAKKQE